MGTIRWGIAVRLAVLLGLSVMLFCQLFRAGPVQAAAGAAAGAAEAAPPAGVRVVCAPLPLVSDGAGCESGMGAELARLACGAAGLSCQFTQQPLVRALAMLRAGEADILIGSYWSEERARYMRFSAEHFYVDPLYVFVRPEMARSPADRPAILRTGVPLGWAIGVPLDQRADLHLESVRTVQLAFSLLRHHRLDAVVAHTRALAESRAVDGDRELPVPLGAPISWRKSYMAFSLVFAESPQRQAFESAYDTVLGGPLYHQILERYAPVPGMQLDQAARTHAFALGGH
ncbi:substrate-binding periplasmic protein [Oleisolibacter albus]|uniref:substrate-binding periplasmic protein n=1 Tax=Oleisolibacter albus TaxID=2171757 RepID=UPI000DF40244|nr:transporter substrate-binding domain-containing protein [Oleisolibacter albus]